jgi:hypothetical protein
LWEERRLGKKVYKSGFGVENTRTQRVEWTVVVKLAHHESVSKGGSGSIVESRSFGERMRRKKW